MCMLPNRSLVQQLTCMHSECPATRPKKEKNVLHSSRFLTTFHNVSMEKKALKTRHFISFQTALAPQLIIRWILQLTAAKKNQTF